MQQVYETLSNFPDIVVCACISYKPTETAMCVTRLQSVAYYRPRQIVTLRFASCGRLSSTPMTRVTPKVVPLERLPAFYSAKCEAVLGGLLSDRYIVAMATATIVSNILVYLFFCKLLPPASI